MPIQPPRQPLVLHLHLTVPPPPPPPSPPRSLEVQQQFVREAERLHQLRHPHVVALYGVALSGPQGILLME